MRPMRRTNGYCFLAILGAFLLFGSALRTQSADYSVSVWTVEEGLPQNRVTSIAQTQDGYLWLGTEVGLARFDGVHFKVLHPINTPGLTDGQIAELFVDSENRLWVSTFKGQLGYFENSVFKIIPQQPDDFTTIRTITSDSNGVLFMSTAEGRLFQWTEQSGCSVLQDQPPWFAPNEVGYPAPIAGWPSRSGNLLVGMRKELFCYSNSSWIRLMPSDASKSGYERPWLDAMAPSRDGMMWVAGDERIQKLDGVQSVDFVDYPWTIQARTEALLEDSEGNLWVGSGGSGLYCFDPHGVLEWHCDELELSDPTILALHEDHEGNIWAGTEWGGLARIKRKSIHTIDQIGDLYEPSITSVAADPNGDLWVGTDGQGLYHIQETGVQHILNNPPVGVRSVIVDQDGDVWVGAISMREHSLFRVHHQSSGEYQVEEFGSPDGGMIVNALYQDSRGIIWVGTLSGLYFMAPNEPSHLEQFSIVDQPYLLKFKDIRTIAEDADGNIWLGTNGHGLFRLPNKDNMDDVFVEEVEFLCLDQGLPDTSVWSLFVDSQNTLWIGTRGGGLSRYRNGEFTNYTDQHGLPAMVITSILEQEGEFWMGSNRGLISVSRENLEAFARNETPGIECTTYGKYEGLKSLECSGGTQPVALMTADNRLWFPTRRGLAVVAPSKLHKNAEPPMVVIESASIDGVSNSRVQGPKPFRVEVPPGKRRLEINYTGLSFTNPGQVRFKYRMEGFDSDWVYAGTRRVAYYNGLPHGKYRFHVTSANNDWIWNRHPAFVSVVVLPYFWQTKTFISCAVLGLIALLIGSVRFLIQRRVRWQMLQLEREHAVANERSRIAHDMHDDLGARLTQIALQGELIQRTAQPSSPLAQKIFKITHTARDTASALDEIVWAVNPKNDNVDRLAAYLVEYVRDYCETVDMACSIEIAPQIPHHPLKGEWRHQIFLCVKEALNNIVKHANATKVEFCFYITANELVITIFDDGRGFDIENIGNLGNGLDHFRTRLSKLGGECKILSKPDNGTRIEFRVVLESSPVNGQVSLVT